MKQTVGHWIPAAFCAFISLIALFASSGPDAGWWRPAFFAFLPMCFFFVGTATSQMQREIRELRKQIVELQEKRVACLVIAQPGRDGSSPERSGAE